MSWTCAQEALRAGLDGLALLAGELGLGLGEQVEDRELLLGQPLAYGALLLGAEGVGQLDQTPEVLIDVQTARVVVSDELLDALHELVAGRVAGGCRDRALLQQRRQPVGLGPLPPGEGGGEGVEVDLGEIDERVRLAALRRGPDHVLLGADRSVEQRVDSVGDSIEVRPGGP